MYHDSCVKRYPKNGLEVIDKSYAIIKDVLKIYCLIVMLENTIQ